LRIRLLEHLAVPVARGHGHVGLVAAQAQVPEGAQDTALRLEGDVHRLQRDARLGRDCAHRRGRIAVADEEPLGGIEDLCPSGGRLLAAPGRLVPAGRLDRLGHFASLSKNSLLMSSNEYHHPRQLASTADANCALRHPRRTAVEASRTLDGADVRCQLHAMWDGVAPAWGRHADFIDERGLEITAALLARTAPAPGDRVLELAAGPGSVGLAAAALVGAEGEVVISDVSPQMTVIAAERAAARELPNVRAEVLDLERIAVPDASFDVVLCREGLMLVPDPAAAAREIRRALRPGGRFALSVWGPRERNPW